MNPNNRFPELNPHLEELSVVQAGHSVPGRRRGQSGKLRGYCRRHRSRGCSFLFKIVPNRRIVTVVLALSPVVAKHPTLAKGSNGRV